MTTVRADPASSTRAGQDGRAPLLSMFIATAPPTIVHDDIGPVIVELGLGTPGSLFSRRPKAGVTTSCPCSARNVGLTPPELPASH